MSQTVRDLRDLDPRRAMQGVLSDDPAPTGPASAERPGPGAQGSKAGPGPGGPPAAGAGPRPEPAQRPELRQRPPRVPNRWRHPSWPPRRPIPTGPEPPTARGCAPARRAWPGTRRLGHFTARSGRVSCRWCCPPLPLPCHAGRSTAQVAAGSPAASSITPRTTSTPDGQCRAVRLQPRLPAPEDLGRAVAEQTMGDDGCRHADRAHEDEDDDTRQGVAGARGQCRDLRTGGDRHDQVLGVPRREAGAQRGRLPGRVGVQG